MIYFRGCVAREKEKHISDATETLLKKAGLDYVILDDEECCGSVLLRTGFVDDAKEQMQRNFAKLNKELNHEQSSKTKNKNNAKTINQKILVSCAGCYKTLQKDYKDVLGVELDVIHISQLLEDLIDKKRIKIKKTDYEVTYHDPCHLGRHAQEYEAPRNVLNEVANLIEMDHNHENAKCCGGGGGVKSAYPEIASNIAQERIKEATKTGSNILITTCPFCILNLKQNNKNDDLEVLDITEFIVRCLEDE